MIRALRASLLFTLLLPPAVRAQATISELFGQSPILAGQTSPLTFTITTGNSSDDPMAVSQTRSRRDWWWRRRTGCQSATAMAGQD